MGFLAPIGGVLGGIGSAVGGLLGGGDAPNRPQAAQIVNPFSTSQVQQSMGQSNEAIAQQQAFLNALASQGGINNQSNVFQQQQALAGQLGQLAQGVGPNPALAQLANATGQNVAQQAALMGSQRGVGANPGLIARQAAMQGAGIQQQSAGQAAALQAQQQLAAIQALQNQQANLAALATQQVGQQQSGLGALNQYSQNLNAQNLGAVQGLNNANVASQQSINLANERTRAQQQQQGAQGLAGLIGGVGTALQPLFNTNKTTEEGGTGGSGIARQTVFAAAHGGQIPGSGPRSYIGKHFASMKSGGHVPGKAKVGGDSQINDTVPTMLSPGEIVVPRSHAMDPDKAAAFARAVSMKHRRK